MRLFTFEKYGSEVIGVFNSKTNSITNLAKAAQELPKFMISLIKLRQSGLEQIEIEVQTAKEDAQVLL